MTTRVRYCASSSILALTVLALLAFASTASADEDGWKFNWSPYYMWMPQLDGTLVVRGVPTEVDYSFSEIFDNLDFVFTSNVRASKGNWGLVADINYLDLGIHKELPLPPGAPGTLPIDIDFKMLTFDGLGSYSLHPAIDVIFGTRIYNLDNTTVIGSDPLQIEAAGSKTWADAVGGVRFGAPLNDRFSVAFRADIGAGGSDLAWHILTGVGIKLSDRFDIFGGYKVLDIDYTDGEANELFGMDTNMRGLIFGVDIKFGAQ